MTEVDPIEAYLFNRTMISIFTDKSLLQQSININWNKRFHPQICRTIKTGLHLWYINAYNCLRLNHVFLIVHAYSDAFIRRPTFLPAVNCNQVNYRGIKGGLSSSFGVGINIDVI